jgi:hypothetical protein
MYPLLKRGDRLPSAAVLQMLLNRGRTAGRKLTVDGVYGSNTRSAVIDFQRPRGLKTDGIVGQNTWPRLIQGTDFRVLDAVDVTSPDELEPDDIRAVGGRPVLAGAMCNGVAQAVQDIIRQALSGGSMVLLRFHGHGSPGSMGISDGTHTIDPVSMTSLTSSNIATATPVLAQLRACFGVYTSIELHGCRVGRGPTGRTLLRQLSSIWGVPVSAGVRSQTAGGTSTFRFEGEVVTAMPGGQTLRSWSKALPGLPEMSVR